jgi:hypothetical protein
MSRLRFFVASMLLAFGTLIFGPDWFIKTLKEIAEDLNG